MAVWITVDVRCVPALETLGDAGSLGRTKEDKGSVFSEHTFFLRTCQARPVRAHTCPGITRRLCGGLGRRAQAWRKI